MIGLPSKNPQKRLQILLLFSQISLPNKLLTDNDGFYVLNSVICDNDKNNLCQSIENLPGL